jgi:hypothetical protein
VCPGTVSAASRPEPDGAEAPHHRRTGDLDGRGATLQVPAQVVKAIERAELSKLGSSLAASDWEVE